MKPTTKRAGIETSGTVAGLSRGALHAVEMPRPLDVAALTPFAPVTGGSVAAPAPLSVHAPAWHASAADNEDDHGLMSRAEFLRIVQREKRRTDRSHSALSLATFEVGDGPDAPSRSVDLMLDRLLTVVRETDYLVRIDDHGAAVLLPDTGEAGLRGFLDKVALASGGQNSAATHATYPGPSFDRVLTERLGTPRSRQSIDVEASNIAPARGYPLKRSLDIVGALVALVLLSPLMLLVSLAVRLTSPGPVIFKQHRIGQGGKPFLMYKFRSMRSDMDDRAHREFVASLIDGAAPTTETGNGSAQFKMTADPRITPIGRFIRKTSIDELPQFYNVLKGEMSLVGPRPPVPYEADRYKPWHRRRLFEMKPGLTGIWQVEGRSKVSFDDMVRMDLRYLRQCSLGFDLLILLRTVKVVLTCDGAE